MIKTVHLVNIQFNLQNTLHHLQKENHSKLDFQWILVRLKKLVDFLIYSQGHG